jgi:hypothetical protein
MGDNETGSYGRTMTPIATLPDPIHEVYASGALQALVKYMTVEEFKLLVRLLGEVITGTGYGRIEIMVREGMIQNILAAKSYKFE